MREDRRRLPRIGGGRHAEFDLVLEDGVGVVREKHKLERPFRLGYGKDCDLRMEGEGGPPVVFEVERTRGPLLVARVVPAEAFEQYVELRIDGEPLHHPIQEISSGSRLEVVDKKTQRRYSVVVQPRRAYLRPRNLAAAIVVLAAVGAGVAGYLAFGLRGAKEDISRAETRLAQAEVDVAATESRLRDTLARVATGEAELARAIAELRALQDASEEKIRLEFTHRLEEIDHKQRVELSRLAEEDTSGRETLAERARRSGQPSRGVRSAHGRVVSRDQSARDTAQ